MNILITGLHGFVGSNLLIALKDNHSIYGLDIIAPLKDGVIETFTWEKLSNKGLPNFDTIIHLAGKAHDTKNQSEAKAYFDVNTGLTQKIYDWFLKSTATKFIFFSSVKAAAEVVESEFLTEEVVPKPVGPYGESKIAAENYILQNIHIGKEVYILRPCMIHGPGNKGNLNLLYSIVKKGIPWPLGAFENTRSFTSIDNLCFIIDGLISKTVESGIYNVADDEALSTNNLIKVICETMRKKPKIWKVNRSFMKFIAQIGSFLHLPLNTDRLQKLTENYIVANKKIKEALEVEKMPITATEGLKKTIKSFLS